MARVRTFCSPLSWKAIRLLEKTGAIRRLSFVMRPFINGQRISIPIRRGVGVSGLVDGEPWSHGLYSTLLEHFPGTFVDVGMNVGQTLVRIRTNSPTVPYVGFEPNPNCVSYLQDLVKRNGFQGVTVLPAGLSDTDGGATLTMNNDSLSDDGASIVADFRPGHPVHHQVAVKVMRFATAEQHVPMGKLGIVKIDVEGGEREVLRSMAARITADRPAVVLEILPVGRPEHVDRLRRQQDIESLFAEMNYHMVRIRNLGADTCLERMEAPIGIHNDQRLANFVVLPADRVEALFPVLDRAIRQQ